MKVSRPRLINITIYTIILVLISAYVIGIINKKNEDSILYVYEEDIIDITQEEEEINIDNEVIEPEIVYDNLTMEQLTDKLNRSLNSDLSGYGSFIATYSLQKGIDPYLATAIMLHETGCAWNCSSLVKNCHNVGGMKGSGCGDYGYFNSLEEGITTFIDNIYNNYYAYGLTNASLMANKYAEDPSWATKVNNYIEKITNG